MYLDLIRTEFQHLLNSRGRRDRYRNTTFTKIQDIVHIWVQDRPRNNHPKKSTADREQSAIGACKLTAHSICSTSTYFCH